MKPSSGEDASPSRAFSRAPKTNKGETATPRTSRSGAPMSFCMKTEKELDESSTTASASTVRDSNYGVQSLQDTLHEAFGSSSQSEEGGKSELAVEDSGDVLRRDKSSSPVRTRRSPSFQSNPPPPGTIQLSPKLHDTLSEVSAQQRRHASTATQKRLETFTLDSPGPDTSFTNTPRSLSIKSFQLSDNESIQDEVSSQVLLSSDEEEEKLRSNREGAAPPRSPQLVMPSIQMPQRREFTERGKSMGRLRVVVAGPKGVGKTELIQAILKNCEDVVHVDPPAQVPSASLGSGDAGAKTHVGNGAATSCFMETSASTKAYPTWWNESDESKSRTLRRKSMSETVLERNLCFIDTPGIDPQNASQSIDSIIRYIETSYLRNCSFDYLSKSEQLAIFSGSGGMQVDVVLFMFSDALEKPAEIEAFRRLCEVANVIPIIGRSDKLAPTSSFALKKSIMSHFYLGGTQPFLFGKTVEELSKELSDVSKEESVRTNASETTAEAVQATEHYRSDPEGTTLPEPLLPFAVSSKLAHDSEIMDASLLMSSGYVQPLVRSDLPTLIDKLFDPEHMAWLRHASAKKFLQWRSKSVHHIDLQFPTSSDLPLETPRASHPFNFPTTLSNPLTAGLSTTTSLLSSPPPSQVLVPHATSPFYSPSAPGSTNSNSSSSNQIHPYALTRLHSHTQREERLAQVHLAKWATDLQRSLRNERERFEQLEQRKRMQWLLERMNEEVREGGVKTITRGPGEEMRADWALVKNGKGEDEGRRTWAEIRASVDPRDPLGLVGWGEEVRRGGLVVLGVGVVGVCCWGAWRVGGEDGGWWGWLGER